MLASGHAIAYGSYIVILAPSGRDAVAATKIRLADGTQPVSGALPSTLKARWQAGDKLAAFRRKQASAAAPPVGTPMQWAR